VSRVQSDLDLRFFTPSVRERTGGRLPGFNAPRVTPDNRVGQEAAQVAQALAQVNPNLQRSLGVLNQQNNQKAIESAIEDRSRLRVTFEEAVEQGLIEPEQSPFYREAWQQRDGIVAARRFRSQMRQELYDSGLINTDDPAELAAFLDERSQELLDGTSRHFALGFASEYDQIADSLFNERDQRWVQNERASSLASFQELTAVEIEDALVAGAFDGNSESLEALGQRLTVISQEAFDNGSISGADLNTALAQTILTIAEEYDLSEQQAMALANSIRTCPNGQSRLGSVAAVRRIIAPRDEQLDIEELRTLQREEARRSLEEQARLREQDDLFETLIVDNYETISGNSVQLFEQLQQEVLDNPALGPAYLERLDGLRARHLSLARAEQAAQDQPLSDEQTQANQMLFADMGLNGATPSQVYDQLERLAAAGQSDSSTLSQAWSAYNTFRSARTSGDYPTQEFAQTVNLVSGLTAQLLGTPETLPNPEFEAWRQLPADDRAINLAPPAEQPNPDYPEWLSALDRRQRAELQLEMRHWTQRRLNEAFQFAREGRDPTENPLTPDEIQRITNTVQNEANALLENGGPTRFQDSVVNPAIQRQQQEAAQVGERTARVEEMRREIAGNSLIPFEQQYQQILQEIPESTRRHSDRPAPNDDVANSTTIAREFAVESFEARRSAPAAFTGGWADSEQQRSVEANLGQLTALSIQLAQLQGEHEPGSERRRRITNQRLHLTGALQVIHATTPPSLAYIETKTANPDRLYTVGLSKDSVYWAEYPLFWSTEEMDATVREAIEDEDHPLRRILSNTGYDFSDPATLQLFAQVQRQRIVQSQYRGPAAP